MNIWFYLFKELPLTQMVNSVVQTLYVSLIFEVVGYMWTFIILGSLATGGQM